MRIPAGRRNTLVTFQQAAEVQESTYGTQTRTWANLATDPTDYAEIMDVLPERAETIMQSLDLARRPCRVRMNYRSDITRDMRVIFGGRTYEIVSGPAVIGTAQVPHGLELLCVEYSTQGEGP